MREQILKDIDAFVARKGISARTLSVLATGDSGFISRLRSGKNVTLDKLERVQQYMHENNRRNRL